MIGQAVGQGFYFQKRLAYLYLEVWVVRRQVLEQDPAILGNRRRASSLNLGRRYVGAGGGAISFNLRATGGMSY